MACVSNYSDTTPIPPTGLQNVKWQKSATLPPIQILTATGTTIVTVGNHGLNTGDLAFVQGGGNQRVTGTWPVTVINPTTFTVTGRTFGTTTFRQSVATVVIPLITISAYAPQMVGDTGSGGLGGVTPMPPPGSGPGHYFLRADGVWAPATGSGLGTVQSYAINFTNVTSVAISHMLGTQNVVVQCYDTTSSPPFQIIPEKIVITDANTVTLSFGNNTTGLCVVHG